MQSFGPRPAIVYLFITVNRSPASSGALSVLRTNGWCYRVSVAGSCMVPLNYYFLFHNGSVLFLSGYYITGLLLVVSRSKSTVASPDITHPAVISCLASLFPKETNLTKMESGKNRFSPGSNWEMGNPPTSNEIGVGVRGGTHLLMNRQEATGLWDQLLVV